MHVYIEDIGAHEGEEVTIKGWLHNRRSSGKIHFLILRDGTGFIQGVMSKAAVGEDVFKAADHLSQETAVIVTGTARADARAPSGYEIDVKSLEVVVAVARLPHHAEGARRRLPARPAPPVDPRRAPAGDPPRAPRDHQRRPRLLQRPRLHPRRHADLHAGRVRGHDDAVPGAVLRGADGVPDAERPALQRGERDGARPRVLLRPDVPRREVEDAPPPDRVLDGRARDGVRRPERRHGPGRGAARLGRRTRARQAPARAQGPRARRREARSRAGAVPAHHLRRSSGTAEGRRAAVRVGRRLRRPGRDGAVAAVRPAGDGPPLSRRRSRRST